ncbi:PadR family transcriptional regulator [Halorientalis brevis]|uniref:PadR family transcriptional regulator n=1 Tax=Halorientalis brevis TaxID=1126241 RepID=A0ABD6CGX7_9EURY|nr:helix-turn-helix transcriptional regulator [Halorientalis brevis]
MATPKTPTPDAIDTFPEYSTFQREVLLAIATLETEGTDPYGLAIKRQLESVYDEEINHGRLYPNLDTLVTDGLVEKTALDKRTNEYSLTEVGEQFLVEQQVRITDVLDAYLD